MRRSGRAGCGPRAGVGEGVSYLQCERRLSDADPSDLIWFEDSKREKIHAYLGSSEAAQYQPALEKTLSTKGRTPSAILKDAVVGFESLSLRQLSFDFAPLSCTHGMRGDYYEILSFETTSRPLNEAPACQPFGKECRTGATISTLPTVKPPNCTARGFHQENVSPLLFDVVGSALDHARPRCFNDRRPPID